MAVTPNGTVVLLQNVPLDKDYNQSIWFASKSAQYTAMWSKRYKVYTPMMYMRRTATEIRVETDENTRAEALDTCNYLMFQNTAYSNKWFYAFIDYIEYINDGVAAIHFTLDPLQTWLHDFSLDVCFVERIHTATDGIGDHTLSEKLDVGPMMYTDIGIPEEFSSWYIVIAATFEVDMTVTPPTITDSAGGMISGIYSGIYYNTYTTAAAANAALELITAQNKQDGIVSIFMYPAALYQQYSPGVAPTFTHKSYAKDTSWTYSKGGSSVTPRNKKLYTFPFNKMVVSTSDGQVADFRYELWSGSTATFTLVPSLNCNPSVSVLPTAYQVSRPVTVVIGNNTGFDDYAATAATWPNINAKLVIKDFPQCGYNVDTFKAWIAQQRPSLLQNIGGLAMQAGISAMAAGPIGAGVTLAAGVAGTMAQIAQAEQLPNIAKGGGSGQVAMAEGSTGVRFCYARVSDEYAAILDDYFDRFGYQVNTLMNPTPTARPHWNFVKTRGCELHGNIPGDAAEAIRRAFDNGVLWWRDMGEVGNFSLDNSPGAAPVG